MGVIIRDKRSWKKGIAYTAVNEAINYIFSNMDIDRFYIETAETNESAIKLFNKLSFKKCEEYFEEDSFRFIVMEKLKTGF